QDAEMIDKQVRALIEYHVHLRNLRRAKVPLLGIPFAPVNLFLALWTWHGTQRSVVRRELYRLGWYRKLYDTHPLHGGLEGDDADGAVWLPRLPAGPSVPAPEAPGAGELPGSPEGQVDDVAAADRGAGQLGEATVPGAPSAGAAQHLTDSQRPGPRPVGA